MTAMYFMLDAQLQQERLWNFIKKVHGDDGDKNDPPEKSHCDGAVRRASMPKTKKTNTLQSDGDKLQAKKPDVKKTPPRVEMKAKTCKEFVENDNKKRDAKMSEAIAMLKKDAEIKRLQEENRRLRSVPQMAAVPEKSLVLPGNRRLRSAPKADDPTSLDVPPVDVNILPRAPCVDQAKGPATSVPVVDGFDQHPTFGFQQQFVPHNLGFPSSMQLGSNQHPSAQHPPGNTLDDQQRQQERMNAMYFMLDAQRQHERMWNFIKNGF